jgi:CHASE3 domain sensor protein
MTMESENEKYNKVLNVLRKSKPALNSTEEIEREVIKRISKSHQTVPAISVITDYMFGWIYIRWVRRALITASAVLIIVFVWQQGIILKRLDYLSRQVVAIDKENEETPGVEIEKVLAIYKNSGRKFPSKTITISEKQMKELFESVNELKIKYKDLENLIEEDPELKKLIEKKLIENNHTKIKL